MEGEGQQRGEDEAGVESAALGTCLLRLARGSIEAHLGLVPVLAPCDAETVSARLAASGATFVTLRRRGDDALRGCLGSLAAVRPLREDVCDNAVAAATRDPRFAAVRAVELPDLRLEVSLLGTPRPLATHDEPSTLAQLRPGIDGVVLVYGDRRSTFLPQVWRQLPEPRDFLAQLKRKAGLPSGFWDPALELSTYRVATWREPRSARR